MDVVPPVGKPQESCPIIATQKVGLFIVKWD